MQDTYRHKGLRKALVEKLRESITDEAVLAAIGKIPRHFFLDPAFVEFAYKNIAFQIGCEQTISQPYTVAFQSQLLEIKPRDKVLEIGTGSGYQACVLLELGAKVFTIERQRELFDKTSVLLPQMGYTPKMFYGDGYKGLPKLAPFHKIIVTCGAPRIPEELFEQLKPGGIMVVPVGGDEEQKMLRIVKKEDGSRVVEDYGSFLFVPMLKNKE
ncbi:MAG: protein-L-isoaspartate(D-aspartate) O-methyltransferase [Bacteroidales bacterium]|jgi:protein-L-isoaspartate(D-aspartate) O-methyltransferase|nr:protein-L-isoaspartate(D-aspartate) O-methyltransferase [Bacteroidales bacterium]